MPNNNITLSNEVAANAVIANAKSVGGKQYAEIPVALLVVHPRIQRNVRGHEKEIAKHWNVNKCAPLIVSYDASAHNFKIIDGQHRFLAAQIVGVETLTCVVYTDLTEAQEAELFVSQRENNRKLTLRDSFPAMLTAGNPNAVSLKALCDEYNVFIIRHNKDDRPFIRSLNTLYRAHEKYGSDCARYVLEMLNRADWLDEKEGTRQEMIEALIRVWRWTSAGKLTTREADSLGAKLHDVSCDEFIANAILARPHSTKSVAISYHMMHTARDIADQISMASAT